MIVQHHLVFGKKYGESFIYPVNGTSLASLYFSTRVSDLSINWGDGSTTNYTTLKNTDFTITSAADILRHGYSTPFIGDIKISSNVINDIYSLKISPTTADKLNVLNFETFINQFKNLYSLVLTNDLGTDIQRATLIGDLSKIPDSLERFKIEYMKGYYNNTTNFYLNVTNFSQNSKLKYFSRVNLNDFYSSVFTCYGDLSKLPPQIQYFNLEKNSASIFTYTQGKTWASSFDTLNLGNGRLELTDTDNLLIDMNNSITTAIGSKVINLANCYRTQASDTAVAYLQSLGFTITVLGIAIDTSTFVYSEISGTNGYLPLQQSGVLTFTTDRKGGNTAILFDNGYLQTLNNLPASNVWSISFWMKNNTNSVVTVFGGELGVNASQTFNFVLNDAGVNYYITIKGASFNRWRTADNLKDNIWHHYVFILDRSKVANQEIQVYIDGIKKNTIVFSSSDTTGDFVSSRINFGQQSWMGSLDDVKIYNRALTQTEIDNLYNE